MIKKKSMMINVLNLNLNLNRKNNNSDMQIKHLPMKYKAEFQDNLILKEEIKKKSQKIKNKAESI